MIDKTQMHDGVRCRGTGCPAVSVCWRVQQPATAKQQWTEFESALGFDDAKCEFFLPIPNPELIHE